MTPNDRLRMAQALLDEHENFRMKRVRLLAQLAEGEKRQNQIESEFRRAFPDLDFHAPVATWEELTVRHRRRPRRGQAVTDAEEAPIRRTTCGSGTARGIDCVLNERRATENYLSESAVRREKGDAVRALAEFEAHQASAWSKRENWRIAAHMSREDLAGTDLAELLDRLPG